MSGPDACLRHSSRGLIVDPIGCILLARHVISTEFSVWAAPGGGVEQGESLLDALTRELEEEVGLSISGEPPLVWVQPVVRTDLVSGYDGIQNHYFLVRTSRFSPRGSISVEQLRRGEGVDGFRWWSIDEMRRSEVDVFSPQRLADMLPELLVAQRLSAPQQIGE